MSEKFGFLFERRFGIRAFDYWWGYTTAQIELMVMDQPVIDYGKEKKGMGNGRADVSEMDALADAWAKRNADEGSMAGKTVNLGDFVNGKV